MSAPAPLPTDTGLVCGNRLRIEYKYERVLVLRLRDLRLEGGESPFAKLPGISIGEAVACAIASILEVAQKFPGTPPRELADDFFGGDDSEAPRTLWLLDGFDEVPRAKAVAATITPAVEVAFDVARSHGLASPSAAPAEVRFRDLPAAGVPPADRLAAVLRVLLTQQNVVISSRPEFEGDLAPLTGRKSARHLRLEPLPTHSVEKFVEGALKV